MGTIKFLWWLCQPDRSGKFRQFKKLDNARVFRTKSETFSREFFEILSFGRCFKFQRMWKRGRKCAF